MTLTYKFVDEWQYLYLFPTSYISQPAEVEQYLNDPGGCVARGTALLDTRHPGWHHKIDLSELDMSSAYRCIFGQLYGYWTKGIDRFELGGKGALAHGITGSAAHLKEAWTDAINARRAADAVRTAIAALDETPATTKELVNA